VNPGGGEGFGGEATKSLTTTYPVFMKCPSFRAEHTQCAQSRNPLATEER